MTYIINILLFIYTKYIGDCDDTLKSQWLFRPAYYIRFVFIYLLSLVLMPFVLFHYHNEKFVDEILDYYKYGYIDWNSDSWS